MFLFKEKVAGLLLTAAEKQADMRKFAKSLLNLMILLNIALKPTKYSGV